MKGNLISFLNFVECPTCREKPGSPELCDSCVERRREFYELIKKLEENCERAETVGEKELARLKQEYKNKTVGLIEQKSILEKQVKDINNQLWEIKKQCTHYYVCKKCKKEKCTCKSKRDYSPDLYVCLICGASLHVHCKESPDHLCHYSDEIRDDNTIELENGIVMDVSHMNCTPDPRHDDCIFCHEPEDKG